jgi:hypothetical protein
MTAQESREARKLVVCRLMNANVGDGGDAAGRSKRQATGNVRQQQTRESAARGMVIYK